jgi:TonB family protein
MPTMLIRFVSMLCTVVVFVSIADAAVAQSSDPSRKAEPAPLKVCSKENLPPCANAPKPLFTPNPEYSEEARKKKCRGTVILETVVGTDGRAHDIQVAQSLSCGLSGKAVQALQKWKFEPGTQDGKPVPVLMKIEMDFRIY